MEKTRDAELEYLKLKLKRWEQKFVAKYERDPGPTDISKYPEVAKVYRSYHQLKEAHKRQQKLEMSLALKQQDDDAKALWKQQRTKKKEPLVPSTLENASSSSRVRRDRTLTPPMMFQTPPVEQTEEYDDEVIPPTPVKAHATFDLGLMDAREDDEEEAYGDLTMGTDNLLAPIQEEENSEKSSVPAQVEIFSRDLDSEEPISASCPPGLQRTSSQVIVPGSRSGFARTTSSLFLFDPEKFNWDEMAKEFPQDGSLPTFANAVLEPESDIENVDEKPEEDDVEEDDMSQEDSEEDEDGDDEAPKEGKKKKKKAAETSTSTDVTAGPSQPTAFKKKKKWNNNRFNPYRNGSGGGRRGGGRGGRGGKSKYGKKKMPSYSHRR